VKSLRDVTPDQLEKGKAKLSEVVYRRARHVIGEIERHHARAEGIRASNWPSVGNLMYASHASLRDDYEVSCKELDDVVEIAEDIGLQRRRLWLPHDRRRVWRLLRGDGESRGGGRQSPKKLQRLQNQYRHRSHHLSSRPAAGATIIKVEKNVAAEVSRL